MDFTSCREYKTVHAADPYPIKNRERKWWHPIGRVTQIIKAEAAAVVVHAQGSLGRGCLDASTDLFIQSDMGTAAM